MDLYPPDISEFGDDVEVMILDHDDVVEFVACCMYQSTEPLNGWGLVHPDDKTYWLGLAEAAVEAVALLIGGPELDEE